MRIFTVAGGAFFRFCFWTCQPHQGAASRTADTWMLRGRSKYRRTGFMRLRIPDRTYLRPARGPMKQLPSQLILPVGRDKANGHDIRLLLGNRLGICQTSSCNESCSHPLCGFRKESFLGRPHQNRKTLDPTKPPPLPTAGDDEMRTMKVGEKA